MEIIKANGLVETGMENPFAKPNHPDLGEENNKTQVNREIRECDCCGGKHNTFCPLKKIYTPQENPSILQWETFKTLMIEQIRIQMDYQ